MNFLSFFPGVARHPPREKKLAEPALPLATMPTAKPTARLFIAAFGQCLTWRADEARTCANGINRITQETRVRSPHPLFVRGARSSQVFASLPLGLSLRKPQG